MDDRRLGSLVRALRLRRGLGQTELALMCGVAQTTISLVERGHLSRLSIDTLRRIGGPLDLRVDVLGRWRGGDADRLLSRAHAQLADSVAATILAVQGWTVQPEASFSIYGERGAIDLLCRHTPTGHVLVIELKTEFVDVNEMLGTLDRKHRLARTIAAERGFAPRLVSIWLIVLDTSTNRRHARDYSALLGARFRLDGRSWAAFLRSPSSETSGLAFWSLSNASAKRSTVCAQRGAGKASARGS